VRALQAAGLFTACLSNTCASHWEALGDPAQYHAIGLLDARYASQHLGVMKPEAAIYRRFEAGTGFSPAEILFFDDVEDNIIAARACGWQAVCITRTDTSVPQIREALAEMHVR
jgi:FMN phosphatase YigB (HAD superfamily)